MYPTSLVKFEAKVGDEKLFKPKIKPKKTLFCQKIMFNVIAPNLT